MFNVVQTFAVARAMRPLRLIGSIKQLRRLTLVLVVFLVGACEPYRVPTVSVPPAAKTIEIIPAFGKGIRWQVRGQLEFDIGKVDELVDTEHSDFETLSVEILQGLLTPRFKCVRGKLDANITENTTAESLATALRARDASLAVPDLYLVLWTSFDFNHTGSVGFRGIGVTKIPDIIKTTNPEAHAYINISVIDGASHSVLASHFMFIPYRTPIKPNRMGEYPDIPLSDLPQLDWKYHWSALSENDRELIRHTLADFLRVGLPFTLAQMHLIDGAVPYPLQAPAKN